MKSIKNLLFSGAVFLLLLAGCVPPGSTGTSDSGFNLLSSYTNSEVIEGIFVKGNYLYAAAGYDGLMIFTVTNNTLSLVSNGQYETTTPIKDVVVIEDGTTLLALCAVGNNDNLGGVTAVDVTDPSSPTNFAPGAGTSVQTAASHDAAAIALRDSDTVLIADSISGVDEYDVTTTGANTGAVAAAASLSTLFNHSAVDVVANSGGTYAIAAARSGGVYFVDIANTEVDAQIINPLSFANAVAVSDDTLAIGDRMGGVLIYDISTITEPTYRGIYSTTGDAFDVIISGSDVYVADGSNGVLWVDFTTITAPSLKARYTEEDQVFSDVFYSSSSGTLVYAACGAGGIRMLEKSGN